MTTFNLVRVDGVVLDAENDVVCYGTDGATIGSVEAPYPGALLAMDSELRAMCAAAGMATLRDYSWADCGGCFAYRLADGGIVAVRPA
jgi:hypothetical protein